MKLTRVAGLLVIAMTLGGCSHAPKTDDSTGAPTGSDAQTGHIETSGAVTVSRDFKIGQCAYGNPGDGLLSGYHMAADIPEGDPTMIMVRVNDYSKDGTYVIQPSSTEAQLAQVINNPTAGALQLMLVQQGAHEGSMIVSGPQSTVSIAIRDNGSKGELKFDKFQDQMKAIMHPGNDDVAPVSGTITWTCAKVDQLAGGETINDAFHKLVPPR